MQQYLMPFKFQYTIIHFTERERDRGEVSREKYQLQAWNVGMTSVSSTEEKNYCSFSSPSRARVSEQSDCVYV